MSEKNRKNNSRPGIPDALHPDIGNGSLWENHMHAFLLRSPDPSKELDALLNDPETKTKILEAWTLDHRLNGEETRNSPDPLKEAIPPVSAENTDQREDNLNQVIDHPGEITSQTDTLTTDVETSKTVEVEPNDKEDPYRKVDPAPEPKVQKAPKAGKRVRKAVKTVSRQEAKGKKDNVAELPPMPTESSLSPFTKWLKGLSGSDYVHPYDDDFAFTQSSGPGKEGISETFAELLAAQGHKDRAVEMYLKLMEKYPEKSGFFAAKIEALQ